MKKGDAFNINHGNSHGGTVWSGTYVAENVIEDWVYYYDGWEPRKRHISECVKIEGKQNEND